MKRVIVMTVLLLLLFAGCSASTPEPAECALCTAFPRHAPCIVDMNSGKVLELDIYRPHDTIVAELSDEQYGGYVRLIHFDNINGILLGADSVELKAPVNATGMSDSLFCKVCRKLLTESNCQGYILADLRNPKTPTVWPIADGVHFSVRCYEIDITASDDNETLIIVMNGILKTSE